MNMNLGLNYCIISGRNDYSAIGELNNIFKRLQVYFYACLEQYEISEIKVEFVELNLNGKIHNEIKSVR